MNSRGAQQALVPGRMVITLNQRSGLPELGVVCGHPSPSPLGAATGLSGRSSSGFGALQPTTAPSTGEFVFCEQCIYCLLRFELFFADDNCA